MSPGNPEALRRAVDFIERSLREDIGASDVADAAFLSPFHFTRVFSAAFGIGPWEWIVRRRIAEAGLAIARGDLDVTEAAFEFRFSGSDVFSRAFRRVSGIAPVEAKWSGRSPERSLFAPSNEALSAAFDASARPALRLLESERVLLRGTTVRAEPGGVDDSAFSAWLEEAAELSGGDAGMAWAVVTAREGGGRSAFSGSPAGDGEDSRTMAEGRWAFALCPLRDRFRQCAAWFHEIALTTADFSVDRSVAVLRPIEGSLALGYRVPGRTP